MGDMADYYYDQLGDECEYCLEVNFQCKCRSEDVKKSNDERYKKTIEQLKQKENEPCGF